MTLIEFIAKWQKSRLTERSAAQSHFLDLCHVLGQPTPAEADPHGAWYAFEKGVAKTGGGSGFADVWRRGHFAWEYKGKRKNLGDAYQQLLQYREDLENPPLLVVCDFDPFEVHTNFSGTVKRVFKFSLADLARPDPTPTCALPPVDVLRALFEDPQRLHPLQTAASVTEKAAEEFARLAASLRANGHPPPTVARFLIRLLFCLFAEDIGLLPEKLFTLLVKNTRARPEEFQKRLSLLFAEMATGGSFGADDIKRFNGDLFTDNTALPLTQGDMLVLHRAAELGWDSIEPSIFGTLFERGLDPQSRARLGAHYTSRDDILLIVEPVLMAPLRRRWAAIQAQALALAAKRDAAPIGKKRNDLNTDLNRLLQGFSEELAQVRVLDPACGSGNFLYVALRQLLDLEKEAITFAIAHDAGGFFPRVGPEQMHGIELNEYAHELAPITVWIGYIQWLKDNGFGQPAEPILRQMDTVRQLDAVLAYDSSGRPVEPTWPEADIIIGNPPFLGDKKMRAELSDAYVDDLRRLYGSRIPGGADFVVYWFERTRALIEAGRARRAGLLATNSIRNGANRKVLDKVKETGDIFMAWADRAWVLDGAAVRVSMVGFDNGSETVRSLDGVAADSINADLSGQADVTQAVALAENAGICFLGMMKAGPFDIDPDTAHAMLAAPLNPNGRPNTDVVRPRINGLDVTRRPRNGWVVDFGVDMSEEDAALYEMPFEYVRKYVKPLRDENRRASTRMRWWIHGEPRRGLRTAIARKARCIVTPEVAKHRLFAWMDTRTIPDHTCHVFARDDDYFFGVLHSRVHELWSLAVGNRMGVGNDPRYNSSRTFETFPFPWPPGQEPADDPRVRAIADAARALVEKRDAWLNPPDAAPAELAKRTLTALYNARPSWLDALHRTLDAATLAAYGGGGPGPLTDAELLERLLALNQARSQAGQGGQPQDE